MFHENAAIQGNISTKGHGCSSALSVFCSRAIARPFCPMWLCKETVRRLPRTLYMVGMQQALRLGPQRLAQKIPVNRLYLGVIVAHSNSAVVIVVIQAVLAKPF